MSFSAKMMNLGMRKVYDYLEKDPKTNLPKLMEMIDKVLPESVYAPQRKVFREILENQDNNWFELIESVWTDIDPQIIRKFFENFIMNANLDWAEKREKVMEEYHCNVPWAILLDPTSACNMHCTGCWAAEYGNRLNLSFDEIDSIITQGKKLGVYMYIYTGGEPLMRKQDLIALCNKHSDCEFLAFTNATLIDEEFADEMLRVKNFIPAISVEGSEEDTDSRRGKGSYQRVVRAMEILRRKKLPFGIGQIGKSFRNEITPGNFTFRTREFEQMELEFFCKPDTDLEWFDYWKKFCLNWLSSLGLKEDEVRYRDHDKEELSFYSKATTDVEFLFPFGWGELWGIADRTDYDLTQHQNVSGQDLTYFDDETKEKYIPYVIEPSLGADRMVLAFLCSAYDEEEIGTEEKPDTRTVLHFHPALAPVKIGVLPLSKKLNEGAEKVFTQLSKKYNCEYDDRGNIGKRYRRQDEIGTPFCVTYDFDSEEDGAVTVRDRDTMEQERIKIEDLDAYFEKKFEW